jgi:hypothetical protein
MLSYRKLDTVKDKVAILSLTSVIDILTEDSDISFVFLIDSHLIYILDLKNADSAKDNATATLADIVTNCLADKIRGDLSR